jgi:putative intracellular protease/amidase
MGGGVSKEKIEQMRDEFLAEDVNNDGTVSIDELKKYRKRLDGDAYDEAQVEADFKKFDMNGDGHLQLDEYLESHGVKHKVAEQVHNEESIKHAMGAQVLTRAEEERHLREKKVLLVLTSNDKLGDTGSQTGWYLPELVHPYNVFKLHHAEMTLASIKGGVAPLDAESITASKDDAECTEFWEDQALKGLTENTKKLSDCKSEDYHAVFFVGGFGTMWDFPDDPDVQRLAKEIYEKGGVAAAVCHGPIAFANVKLSDGEALVKGKEVCGFTNEEEDAVQRRTVVPFTNEDKLTAAGGIFKAGPAWGANVCVAGTLITGQNPASAKPAAEAVVKALYGDSAAVPVLAESASAPAS